jgi:pyrroline-5-carboxylate reductase
MANALIGGMLKQGFAATDIQVIDPGAEARAKLAAGLCASIAVEAPTNAAEALPDLLVLAVKPQQMKEAVAPLAGKLGAASSSSASPPASTWPTSRAGWAATADRPLHA